MEETNTRAGTKSSAQAQAGSKPGFDKGATRRSTTRSRSKPLPTNDDSEVDLRSPTPPPFAPPLTKAQQDKLIRTALALVSSTTVHKRGGTHDAGVQLPDLLHHAVERRAAAFPNISAGRVIAVAVNWFLLHERSKKLPRLLIDHEALPQDDRGRARVTRFLMSTTDFDAVDELAKADKYGNSRSSVVRAALSYYFSAIAMGHFDDTTDRTAHLINTPQ